MSISRVTLALGLCLAAPLVLAATPVGHWTGKMTIKTPTLPPGANPQQKAMMEKVMSQMAQARIILDMKANKTFTVSMNGMPQAQGAKTEAGTWSQKGNVVTTSQSKPGSKPQSMTLSPDGKTLTLTIPGGQGKVVFTK